jgi:hypothetical protein
MRNNGATLKESFAVEFDWPCIFKTIIKTVIRNVKNHNKKPGNKSELFFLDGAMINGNNMPSIKTSIWKKYIPLHQT